MRNGFINTNNTLTFGKVSAIILLMQLGQFSKIRLSVVILLSPATDKMTRNSKFDPAAAEDK